MASSSSSSSSSVGVVAAAAAADDDDGCCCCCCSAVQTDLHLQLTDQRLQLEECRINRSKLQSSYQRLEDELAAVRDELKSVVEERDRTVSRYKCLLEETRIDLTDKQNECEKYKFLNPQRVKLMRNEIHEKLGKLFHSKLEQMSGDLQHVRHDFSRVSHELSLCEAELVEEKQESVTAINDVKRKHDSELSSWKMENERLRQKKNLESSDAIQQQQQQLHQLRMENAQLLLQRKHTNDVKTIEKTTSDDDRLPSVVMTTTTDDDDMMTRRQEMKNRRNNEEEETRVKQLKGEKLTMDSDDKTEVDKEERNRLLDEIHELEEKDRNVLKRQMEELKTQFQLDISKLRLEKTTECGELKKRLDEMEESLNAANDELKELKADMTAEKDKARTNCQELQDKLDAEWKKLNCLQKEKKELERKLDKVERRRREESEEDQRMMETVQQRLTKEELEKEDAEHQAATYRAQLESEQWLLSRATFGLKLQLKSCLDDSDYNYLQSCSLREQLEKVDRISVDLHKAKTELIQSQAVWTKDKQQMLNEIQDLREELARLRKQSISNLKFYKGRLKVWEILEKKFKQNLEVLRSELSKLKIEKESTTCYERPAAAHASYSAAVETRRRQLSDLMEKHRQFSAIMLLPTTAAAEAAAAAAAAAEAAGDEPPEGGSPVRKQD